MCESSLVGKRASGVRRFIVLMTAATFLVNCSAWHQKPSVEQVVAAKEAKRVRVTQSDGTMTELTAPSVRNDSLIGEIGSDGTDSETTTSIALGDIRKLEAWESDGTKTALLIVGIGLAGLALLVLAAANTPPGFDGELEL